MALASKSLHPTRPCLSSGLRAAESNRVPLSFLTFRFHEQAGFLLLLCRLGSGEGKLSHESVWPRMPTAALFHLTGHQEALSVSTVVRFSLRPLWLLSYIYDHVSFTLENRSCLEGTQVGSPAACSLHFLMASCPWLILTSYLLWAALPKPEEHHRTWINGS